MTDISFNPTSTPGQKPGEGRGRNLNIMIEVNGKETHFRPVPGSVLFADTTLATPRGLIDKAGLLYGAALDRAYTCTSSGVVTLLTGALTGTKPVTWAKNNAAPTPDLVVVSENGCFSVTSTTVSAFADADLPQPNSVTGFKNYFIWTTGGGRVFSSGLNAVTVDALAFQNTEGPLKRGTASGPQFFAWGDDFCNVYQDAGTSPFPLGLVTRLNVGLRGTWAIAGFGPGWDREQIFVATDGSVRAMRDLSPVIISHKDVERDIAGVIDREQLFATAYVVAGSPIWSLSGPTFTWEYNLATEQWHERKSNGLEFWRSRFAALFAGEWRIGDTQSTRLLTLFETAYTENGSSAINVLIEGEPVKQFPFGLKVARAFFDWTTGQGLISGSEDETNPKVSISWSFDGGGTWTVPVIESLLGGTGEFVRRIMAGPIGITSHHGVRFRLESSSPVYKTFRGGRVEIAGLRAA